MKTQKLIYALLPCALLSLALAIASGWMRLGIPLQALPPSWALFHGPWMVAGFLGIVIGLERAFALRKWWCFTSPLLCACGSLALLASLPKVAAFCFCGAGLGLVAIFIHIYRLQATFYHACLLMGAGFFFLGNALWLFDWPIPSLVNAWALFLLFTIAGERLELTRFRSPSALSLGFFKASLLLLGLGLFLHLLAIGLAWPVLGMGLLGLAGWLLSQDIARQNLRQSGLAKYMAVALLAGYAWLLMAGGIALTLGSGFYGFAYDAYLHSIFLGFVFSMIFAHGPLILPSLLGLRFEFRDWLYAPLGLLHASLLLRMIGDFSLSSGLRQASGLLSAIAIAFFLLSLRACLKGSTNPSSRSA